MNGGPMNPLFTPEEISLLTFKQWFPIDFIRQLYSFLLCGNLGDPIIAQDCLEIIQYLRECNSDIQIHMHTNGSARSADWWRELALTNVKVTFGIDGDHTTHNLYRVSTDYFKIIENATAFINAGGAAEWHMLVFKHNEHQIESCKAVSEQLGFAKFIIKHTTRFVDGKFHVLDESGRTVNILYPTDKSVEMSLQVKDNLTCKTIDCKAIKYRQLYIGANGVVSPCCWLDLSWHPAHHTNRIDYMDQVGELPNLYHTTLQNIFESNYFNKIERSWSTQPLLECSKQCGRFDKMGGQFVN
jgi:sulfatase maturation enzyme AslB (radical SAM superfamily)